jgi:hypothetical protein
VKQNEFAMSRRWMLGASGAVLLAAGCKANGNGGAHTSSATEGDGGGAGSAPVGAVGVDFNEDPVGLGFPELKAMDAGWLRGFVAFRPGKDLGDQEHRTLSTLLKASERGYGTILSLKLPHNGKPFPSPDSSEMKDVLARVDKVLDMVMNKMSIVVVGNEPFIESRKQDWNGPLGDFYEKAARHVLAYRTERFPKKCRTRLYMGALNHLEKPQWRGKGAERWMEFARKTDGIEGVDIHPHVTSLQDAKKYLDFVVPRLRKDQKFLATEFSLVQLYEQHLSDPIPRQFAERYKMSQHTKVWEAIKDAIDNPWPEKQWQDMLAMSPWYARHKHYMRNQVKQFRATGRLAVATCQGVQGVPSVTNFGPKKKPWLLTAVCASRTARPGGESPVAGNYGLFDDFRAVQREQDEPPVHTGTVS